MATQQATKAQAEIYDVLAATAVFGNLAPDTLADVVSIGKVITLSAGMDLFRPGDTYKDQVYVLLRGDLAQRRASGHESRPQAGDIVGLANYLDCADYSSHVRAITHCELLALEAQKLQQLEEKYPELFSALQVFIAQKLRSLRSERGISGVLAYPVNLLMKSPAAQCGQQVSLKQAFEMMDERHIGSLVIKDAQEHLVGVLTYHGLAKAILVDGIDANEPVSGAACEIPITIAADTPLWQAESKLKQHNLKYLIVCENQKAVGMISQTDILRALTSHPGLLTTQIPEANSLNELARQYQRIIDVAVEAREGHHSPTAAIRLISETHRAIQRRVIELTLQEMPEEAPTDFAVLIMGSGGRREMMLNPDQDNGIILADDTPETALPWVEAFCNRMNNNLNRVGYILCPGEIMARNPMYRKRLADWKQQIDYITQRPTEKAARWSNIVFDFDTLYGDESLTSELRRHVLSDIAANPHLLNLMTEHDAEGRPAIGFFNQLRTSHGKHGEFVDLKRNGLRIITDAARIFALQSGVAARSTPDRLDALVHLGKFSSKFITSVNEAYEELLDLLLEHQISQVKSGKQPDKLINVDNLTEHARSALRMAMRSVKRIQDALQDEFGTEIF